MPEKPPEDTWLSVLMEMNTFTRNMPILGWVWYGSLHFKSQVLKVEIRRIVVHGQAKS
jgi:hypothetical protein